MPKSNLKKFRILYNKLDELLSTRTHLLKKMSFIQKLNKFMQEYPSYAWLKDEVRLIHDLRNVIIHEEKHRQDIAIPTEAFLKRVEEILTILENPQTALDIASTELFCCDPNDRILEVVQMMVKEIYSQVPVLEDKKSRKGFIGVFSETCLTHLLGSVGSKTFLKGLALNEKAKVGEMLELVKKPINQSWDFTSKDTDVYKIKEMFHTRTFDNAAIPNSRLGSLFVTESGRKDEELLGIITTWDLSKIDHSKKAG